MDYGIVLGGLHQLVSWLLYPVIVCLSIALVLVLWEAGLSIAEKLISLKVYLNSDAAAVKAHFKDYAMRRIERVDLLARSGPILGLMGTLIPLGPGLTALGSGNIDILATALTVAFDTTVVGLLIGLVAYVLGRIRRRWYEKVWDHLSSSVQTASKGKSEQGATAMHAEKLNPKEVGNAA